MQLLLVRLFVLATVPVIVFACEGDCIVGITDAFIGNYSEAVSRSMIDTLESLHLCNGASCQQYLDPVMMDYKQKAYGVMETAIFPSYFHGKCQQNGIDPPGCPNPDCPVVCGTPGSLIHFYDILRSIAFNATCTTLKDMTASGSPTYVKMKKTLMAESQRPRRMLRFYSRSVLSAWSEPAKRSGDAESQLMKISSTIGDSLAKTCGGKDALSECSWKEPMKAYILSFP